MGSIYMLIGKSASGKDHIYKRISTDEELGLKPVILYTTRPMRKGEADGKEYHFTDVSCLQRFREQGKIIEERVYPTVFGDWYYFTADDGSIDRNGDSDYITIGTLESYIKMKEYYGSRMLSPIYIEVDDGIRLLRAVERERKQSEPGYREVCRRFLADCDDFSEDRLKEAGIEKRFYNNSSLEDCINDIREYIKQMKKSR